MTKVASTMRILFLVSTFFVCPCMSGNDKKKRFFFLFSWMANCAGDLVNRKQHCSTNPYKAQLDFYVKSCLGKIKSFIKKFIIV